MRTVKLISCLLIFTGIISCTKKESAEKTSSHTGFTVAPAPEWTNLFKRDSGWFGGDGIFAIPYNGVEFQGNQDGDSILFLFSDTMVGHIKEGRLQPGFVMVNNSVAFTTGKDPATMRFMVAEDESKKPATLFLPKTASTQPGDYYWLGDGFVNHAMDSSLYIFAYRIRNTNDSSMFPFRTVGNALLVIDQGSKFPFENHKQLDLPIIPQEPTSGEPDVFGAAVLVNTIEAGSPTSDGFVYIYGIKGKNKQLIVSRVKPGNIENFNSWEYWNGSTWSDDIAALSAVTDSVSNELSVTVLPDGKFGLIYQYAGIFPQIFMQVGDTPVGPFGPRIQIWNTNKDIQDQDLFTYNAKAHPSISNPGELLISYNVNSFKFHEVIENKPNLYRPRFIKLVFSE